MQFQCSWDILYSLYVATKLHPYSQACEDRELSNKTDVGSTLDLVLNCKESVDGQGCTNVWAGTSTGRQS